MPAIKYCIAFCLLLLIAGTLSGQYRLKQTIEETSAFTLLEHLPNSNAIAAGDADGNIYLFNSKSSALITKFQAHNDTIRTITFNSTGQLIMTHSKSEIRIWSLNGFHLMHQIVNSNFSDIRFALFSIADGFIYFSSGSRLYKTRSDLKKESVMLFDFTDKINAAVITADRSALIISTGKTMRVINTRTDNIIQELNPGNSIIRNLSLLPGGKVASWSDDGTVSIWKMNFGTLEINPFGFKAGISSPMAFSRDGKMMVSGLIGNWARIWNWEKREITQELFGHNSTVTSFAFSGDDEILFTGSLDKAIRVWTRRPEEKKTEAVITEQPVKVEEPVKPSPKPDASPVRFDEKNIPVAVNGRTVSQSESFEVDAGELVVAVFDNLVIDGDTISLSFNGEWLLKNYGVTREKKYLNLSFIKGNNSLVLYAENLGKSPPNTAAISFKLGGREKFIRLRSDLKSCSAVNFFYK